MVEKVDKLTAALDDAGFPSPATDKAAAEQVKKIAGLMDLRSVTIEMTVEFMHIVSDNDPLRGIDASLLAMYLLSIPGKTYITGIEIDDTMSNANLVAYKIRALNDTLPEGAVLTGQYNILVYEKPGGGLVQYNLFQGMHVQKDP